jgi:hypothetical protein
MRLPAPSSVEPLPAIPGYEVLGVLGRGGSGVVYKARHVPLDRTVALKVIRAASPAGGDVVARLHQEARALARLQHPNIVQVHDVGLHGDQPFLAMEYVAGGTLADRLTGQPQPPAQAAALVEALARAIHAAHRVGIVHRDLKPANVLLSFAAGPGGSATDYGLPKITDFGLAKHTYGEAGLTQTGLVMGTPSYMAPEQAQGLAWASGPACDVYALGSVLYHLLAGRPPFRGSQPIEILMQVVHQEPPPLRSLVPQVPRDLETICLKCLEKDPHRRYASAEALADDLRRFRTGVPIQARAAGPAEVAWQWARRNPAAAAWMVVLMLILLVGFPALTMLVRSRLQAPDTNPPKDRAPPVQIPDHPAAPPADAAGQLRPPAEQQAARQALDRGLALCKQGEVGPGLLWMARGLEDATRAGDAELQGAARVSLGKWGPRLSLPGPRVRLPGAVGAAAFGPDGRTALVASGGTARRYDVVTGRPVGPTLQPFSSTRGVNLIELVAFSPTGRTALTATADGSVSLWDLTTGRPASASFVPGQGPVQAVAFSPDGKVLLTGGADGVVRLWDRVRGRALGQPLRHQGPVSGLALSRDGKTVLTGSADGTARLWDAATGRPVGQRLMHRGKVLAVAFGPDGRTVLTACQDGTIQAWHAASAQPRGRPFRPAGGIRAAAFSPAGGAVVVVSGDRAVRVWDWRTGSALGPLLGHAEAVQAVAWAPDGRTFLAGCRDGTAQFWQRPAPPVAGSAADVKSWVQGVTGLELDQSGMSRKRDAGGLKAPTPLPPPQDPLRRPGETNRGRGR